MSTLGKDHWQAVKRVFCYIKGTIFYALLFVSNGKDFDLYDFSDTDWGDDVETRRSS